MQKIITFFNVSLIIKQEKIHHLMYLYTLLYFTASFIIIQEKIHHLMYLYTLL